MWLLNNGCKACEGCKTKPSIVNEICEVCWACENREGMLRWKDEGVKEKQDEQLKIFEEKLRERLIGLSDELKKFEKKEIIVNRLNRKPDFEINEVDEQMKKFEEKVIEIRLHEFDKITNEEGKICFAFKQDKKSIIYHIPLPEMELKENDKQFIKFLLEKFKQDGYSLSESKK